MPPPVATLLTLAFIAYLFRRDIREKPDVSGALWLPLLWLTLSCSRPVSEWFNIFGLPVSGGASVEEGSPLDAWFYFGLIAVGLCVLNKRQVRLSEVVSNNSWLIIFLIYCFISIAWSDFPFVAFKRWIKILGHPIMVLIVLTEPDPKEALIRLMKRCAYVVVPVSILWIKYYPELGRGFSPWGGAESRGIATGKNFLGADCLILGYFFFWYLLQTWQTERSRWRRNELWLIAGFLIGYLVAFLAGPQCHISHISDCRDTSGRVCWYPFYKQESHRDIHVTSISPDCRSRAGVWDFRAFFRESRQGLHLDGENAAVDSPPWHAYQSDFWDRI